MIVFPAIDILGGSAVRLQMGDYGKKTVFDKSPLKVARSFEAAGAAHLHLVDLDGAKSGNTDNFEVVKNISENTGMFIELGGGCRTDNAVARYFEAGVNRVIIGTAAVKDEPFLDRMLDLYGDKIAVGVDIKDGRVAIRGWTELTDYSCERFFEKMQKKGVKNIICTDISRDGMSRGTNVELYKRLAKAFAVDITASGGVSGISDIAALSKIGIYGAVIGRALYTGGITIESALEAAK